MYKTKPYYVERRFNSRGGINVPMKTFDSLGQERFKKLSTVTIEKASGILMVFDVASEE